MAGEGERESWGNYWEFFLTSLGLAVGLGNVWRFPYVAYTNGGGSFLIPYLIMLLVVGVPAFWVELSVGQVRRDSIHFSCETATVFIFFLTKPFYILFLAKQYGPLLYISLQYGRVGANKVYGRMAPAFKGLGYGMLVVRQLVNVYYVIICAWAFFYLFAGFQSDLPWASCEEEWNTKDCYTKEDNDHCNDGFTYYNFECTQNEVRDSTEK